MANPPAEPDQLRRPGPDRTILLVGSLVWLALVALWLTWSPFDLSTAGRDYPPAPTSAFDLLGNLVLLAPFGATVAALAPRRGVLLAALAGALVSAGMEAGQIYLPDRVVSVVDLLLNTAGAAAGAAVMLRLRARVRPCAAVLALVGLVYTAFLLQAAWAGYSFRRGMNFSGWNPSFGIAIGDESQADVGGIYVYQGQVENGVICAGAGTDTVCAGPSADAERRDRLVRHAEEGQWVMLRAAFMSASDSQAGPRRLVTFSRGGYQRNATLGQEHTALVVRLRTALMGENGRRYELRVPDAIHAGTPETVEVVARRGDIRVSIASTGQARVEDFRLDGLAGAILLRGPGAVSSVEVTRSRRASLVVLVFPALLLPAAFAFRRRQTRSVPPGPTRGPA